MLVIYVYIINLYIHVYIYICIHVYYTSEDREPLVKNPPNLHRALGCLQLEALSKHGESSSEDIVKAQQKMQLDSFVLCCGGVGWGGVGWGGWRLGVWCMCGGVGEVPCGVLCVGCFRGVKCCAVSMCTEEVGHAE